ncbi:MAG TPA: hypothetical protein PKZ24_10210, partial [Nitrospirales bacterium]|nr:hypothetical protein [Nitrospirales bacterium]
AVVVGIFDDLVKEIAGAHRFPDCAIAWVAQVKVGIVLHRGHELIADGDGDIDPVDIGHNADEEQEAQNPPPDTCWWSGWGSHRHEQKIRQAVEAADV